jgi:hypothetical protein
MAASQAACSGDSAAADTPKWWRAAASAPNTPSPHSAKLRYSSRMRRLGMVVSSIHVINASCPFRSHERLPDRNRFLASCWLMVEAPATIFPRRSLRAMACWIASQSKPSWSRKRASSAATTARFRCGEMRAYGTH